MAQETSNRVLCALPAEARRDVLAACERVELEGRTILDRSGETPAEVHFPETAVISTIATYRDGSSIEMANIGREACTGIGLVLGHPRQLNTNEVQIGGRALAMPVAALVDVEEALPAFRTALFSTVQALFYQVMVSGACNGAHTARQRLARWLLTMRDRNDWETMALTHDFLAEMLGVRRATVTGAARELQAQGLISYGRGQVRISDPAGLRQVSCECYDLVRTAYDELLPARGGSTPRNTA
ncbi:Crp/Fnr family transcriptional regulator [Marinibaculum pumilum]|uniref:Crp/Fnr family transcriptional regulator n=1 Tax=Marinibaculum pumilum TaxID=1766165 RepID=A0ABV7L7E4_9PROT